MAIIGVTLFSCHSCLCLCKLVVYACYVLEFHPIPHEDYWPQPDFPILHPNPEKLQDQGRPRSSRMHNEMDWREPSAKIRCGACKQESHNRRKCPNKEKGEPSNKPN